MSDVETYEQDSGESEQGKGRKQADDQGGHPGYAAMLPNDEYTESEKADFDHRLFQKADEILGTDMENLTTTKIQWQEQQKKKQEMADAMEPGALTAAQGAKGHPEHKRKPQDIGGHGQQRGLRDRFLAIAQFAAIEQPEPGAHETEIGQGQRDERVFEFLTEGASKDRNCTPTLCAFPSTLNTRHSLSLCA